MHDILSIIIVQTTMSKNKRKRKIPDSELGWGGVEGKFGTLVAGNII